MGKSGRRKKKGHARCLADSALRLMDPRLPPAEVARIVAARAQGGRASGS